MSISTVADLQKALAASCRTAFTENSITIYFDDPEKSVQVVLKNRDELSRLASTSSFRLVSEFKTLKGARLVYIQSGFRSAGKGKVKRGPVHLVETEGEWKEGEWEKDEGLARSYASTGMDMLLSLLQKASPLKGKKSVST